MAFRSNSPITVALPPFRGVTRRIILIAVVMFFVVLVAALVSKEMVGLLTMLLSFDPSLAYKLPWQLVTYPFINSSILGILFAALTVWFFGASLEDELGSRWMAEFFFASTIGGALIAGLLTFTLTRRVPGLSPFEQAAGLWPFSIALLVAFARLHADQELNFNFILRVKAKYMAAVYVLFYVAVALSRGERFDAVLVLTNSLCGWLFLAYAPRRGIRFGMQERVYGLQNAWVRARRRRAAKKFSVYMQKQGREVHFDSQGRYIDPDNKHHPRDSHDSHNSKDPSNPNDPKNRRWMN